MLARKPQASKAPGSRTRPQKGHVRRDVHPALSRRELEQLLFDAARMRAAIARSRSVI
jgi:hypothetical protein